jgi:hypothetical protein
MVQVGPAGLGLRRLARRLIALRGPGRADAGGLVTLVVALAALTEEISAWHRDGGRPYQARAATHAAQALRRSQPEVRGVEVTPAGRVARTDRGRANDPALPGRRRAAGPAVGSGRGS